MGLFMQRSERMASHRFTKEEMAKMGIWAMSPEERREAQRRGGLKTAALAKRRKHMQEIAAQVLSMPLDGADEVEEALRKGGFEDADINYAAGIVMVQTKKAMSGDTKAAEFVRDTSGQKPVDGLVVGNLDNVPFETIDLGSLTDDQLRELISAKYEQEEEEL